jgi:uncharacterized membrane protein YkoI
MKTWLRWSFVLAYFLAGTAGHVAASRADTDHELARSLVESGAILPLETILSRARTTHPGRVLETELEHRRGRYIYELEILDNKGVVWELKYNAKTGNLIKTEPER